MRKEHGSTAVNQLLVEDVEPHRAGIQVMGAWPDHGPVISNNRRTDWSHTMDHRPTRRLMAANLCVSCADVIKHNQIGE